MAKQQDNHVKAAALARRIAEEVKRSAGLGLNAARIFLAARVKEALSEPAPRKRVTPPGGVPYYVATTPATVGRPPRKLSGKERQSVHSEMMGDNKAVVGVNAKSAEGFDYPSYQEQVTPGQVRSGEHPFLLPTAKKYEKDLVTLVGEEVRIS